MSVDFASDLRRGYEESLNQGTIVADVAQAEAIDALENLWLRWRAPQKNSVLTRLCQTLLKQRPTLVRGVYLYGGVGRGKSMLMKLFATHAPPQSKIWHVHFHVFMQQTHDQLQTWRQADVQDPLQQVAKDIAARSNILCFDEFFVRDIADAMILGRLFRLLFARGMVVIATSNIAIKDLYAHGLQRQQFLPFIDIFHKHMIEINLDGGVDYRRQNLSALPRYYHRRQQEDFERAFAAATQGLHCTPLVVEVMGRQLHYAQHYRGTLRCTFASLCDTPLAARDYLALAKSINTLFLEDIFIIDNGEHEDAARRLLYLIDCLYEAGCSLFLLAEAPIDRSIEALYRQGRLEQEFQRATSRLYEMQSAAYLVE